MSSDQRDAARCFRPSSGRTSPSAHAWDRARAAHRAPRRESDRNYERGVACPRLRDGDLLRCPLLFLDGRGDRERVALPSRGRDGGSRRPVAVGDAVAAVRRGGLPRHQRRIRPARRTSSALRSARDARGNAARCVRLREARLRRHRATLAPPSPPRLNLAAAERYRAGAPTAFSSGPDGRLGDRCRVRGPSSAERARAARSPSAPARRVRGAAFDRRLVDRLRVARDGAGALDRFLRTGSSEPLAAARCPTPTQRALRGARIKAARSGSKRHTTAATTSRCPPRGGRTWHLLLPESSCEPGTRLRTASTSSRSRRVVQVYLATRSPIAARPHVVASGEPHIDGC